MLLIIVIISIIICKISDRSSSDLYHLELMAVEEWSADKTVWPSVLSYQSSTVSETVASITPTSGSTCDSSLSAEQTLD